MSGAPGSTGTPAHGRRRTAGAGGGADAGAGAPERIFTYPLVLLMAANGLLRTGTQMLIALVPLYVLDQGASATVAGLTTTFYMMAAVVLRPLSGTLVDTRGRYAVMTVGAVLYCAATGLYLLTLPVVALCAVRVLQGVGFALNGTAVMTLATDLIPESRMSEGIGYLGLEQTVGQLLGPWLALELRETVGYRGAFAVAFACGVANVLLRMPLRSRTARADTARVAAHREDRHGGAAAGRRRPLWARIVDRDAWRPSSVMFLLMFSTAGVNTFLAAYVISRGIGDAGLFFTASGLMLAVSRLTAGRAGRRWGTAWVLAPGIALLVLSQLGIWWAANLPELIIAGAAYGLGMGAAQPTLNSLAVLSAGKERRGRANSTYFMAMDLSQALGAPALGGVAVAAGTGSVFLTTAVLTATALALAFALSVLRRARPDGAAAPR